MSAEVAIEELDIDLESNRATASLSLDVDELFDENGELRLWDDGQDWSGYVHEDGSYYAVDTRRDEDDWTRRVRVGQRAVRLAVEEHLKDPAAGGPGRFVRGARP